MISKKNDYTDISFLGTTGQTEKSIFTVGSTGNNVNVGYDILIHDITISNQTGSGGEIKIFSDISTAGDDVYIYASPLAVTHVSRQIPFDWHFVGSSGVKQHVYASAFAGAGVKTYIGAILQ